METVFLILLIIFFLVAFALTANFNMHMFQLNSYKPNVQMKWLSQNKGRLIPSLLLIIIAGISLISNSIAGFILSALTLIISALANKPNKKAKKPLVYTNRVKRMFVTLGVLALITIIGACMIKDKTCSFALLDLVCAFTPMILLLANMINKPVEQGINNGFINEAKDMLKNAPNLTVIGVTGSYGKTSVKFYLNTLLKAKYSVLMTPESFNTPLGVVRTVRESLKATHEIFICEMGAKNVGDIKEICDIVHPKHGIITSVGPQHLESFKTLDNVKKTKFELADALGSDGMLFLNGDDKNIADYSKNYTYPKPAINYGIDDDSEYSAYDLKLSEKGTNFKVRIKNSDETEEFTTKLIGRHNVLNIVGAIAVSHKLGISLKDLKPQVRKLENVPHRLQLIDRGTTAIIDDAYNSNPNGTKVALETLKLFHGMMKIVVTPGMVELGDKQDEYNFQFGQNMAEVCDFVALVGRKQTQSIYNGLIDKGYPEDKIFVADALMEAMGKVNSLDSEGRKKVILLENDLPDNY